MEDTKSRISRSVIVSMNSSSPSPTNSPIASDNGLGSSGGYSTMNGGSGRGGGGGSSSSGGNNNSVRKYPVGIPLSAPNTCYTAPVHIDVGGKIYTSSLETLTKYPESRLAKLFNGNIAIVLDSLKQHYFLDRDGRMFRHVLNYVRHGRLMVPKDFTEWALLYEEALWFAVPGMAQDIEEQMDRKPSAAVEDDSEIYPRPAKRKRTSSSPTTTTTAPAVKGQPDNNTDITAAAGDTTVYTFECITINITPDLGERITLTAEKAIAEEIFPEVAEGLTTNGRSHAAWNTDPNQLTRFPLNGYCKLNSTQVVQRLLNAGFSVAAGSGGGMESQYFTEYLFVRRNIA
ncbi:BTB/POZ domain-containing protein KCTD15 [Hypsibius exemplaris]|uniref:BTB/POZ domain-containing protein KCTD15 n=1 Tax=Hypsibius exemplaris TaxID=2072580 RepID=A0A1W0WB43_HYPEX|nr:BTB/POZ domain-containing protein KCTD15 [Hypsibius exemplaris]